MTKNYNTLPIIQSTTLKVAGLVIASLGLWGCNKADDAPKQATSTTTQSASDSASSTAQSTQSTATGATPLADNFVSKLPNTAPVYKVATTGTMAPFSFANEKGALQGFDIDALRAIGEAGGFKVEFYKMPFKTIFDDVATGKYDLGASAISYTDERKGKYNLSDSYFFNPSAIMYKTSATPITTLAELKNSKVAGMTGSKQPEQVKNATGLTSINTYDTTYLLFQALVQGKEQAIVQDEPFLRYTANNFPNEKMTIVAYENKDEPSAQQVIIMPHGKDELTAKVNKGLATVKANGELQKLEQKWFGKK